MPRTKGSPNNKRYAITSLAHHHAPKSIAALVHIAEHGESEAARVAAAKEILDRAIGRPVQPHAGESGEGPVIVQVITGVPR